MLIDSTEIARHAEYEFADFALHNPVAYPNAMNWAHRTFEDLGLPSGRPRDLRLASAADLIGPGYPYDGELSPEDATAWASSIIQAALVPPVESPWKQEPALESPEAVAQTAETIPREHSNCASRRDLEAWERTAKLCAASAESYRQQRDGLADALQALRDEIRSDAQLPSCERSEWTHEQHVRRLVSCLQVADEALRKAGRRS